MVQGPFIGEDKIGVRGLASRANEEALATSNSFAVMMFVLLGGSQFYFARKKLE